MIASGIVLLLANAAACVFGLVGHNAPLAVLSAVTACWVGAQLERMG
jgi:hypothetical protein